MTTPIPAADLPLVTPGASDSVVGVQLGNPRRFPLNNLGGVSLGIDTLATLQTITNLVDGSLRLVTNDPDPDNNGVWRWDATATEWVPSDDRVAALENRVEGAETVTEALNDGDIARFDGPADAVCPVITDTDGRVLLGYDPSADQVIGKGVMTASKVDAASDLRISDAGGASFTGTSGVDPIRTDADGRVLLGVDLATGRVFGKGLGYPQDAPEALASPPVAKALNHLLFDGQSLSVGMRGTPVLSATQPYSNVTFNGGPRAWNGTTWTYAPLKPLVEDATNPGPDGNTVLGETCCSGAANFATTLAALDGADPADHVILASTVGHGAYRIDQLKKGSAWYANLTAMVTAAKGINSDYAVHAIGMLQGEANADPAVHTPYATYRADMSQFQVDAETDIKAITGQASPVYFLTYQLSYGAAAWPDQAKAYLDLAQTNDKFFLVTPMYHFPYYSDGTHLTNVGYKWCGAYFGRAYKHLAIDGVKPRWLNPVSATRRGDVIRVRFQVPVRPLMLDITTLAATTNYGFRVVDSGGTVAIDSVYVDGDDVVLALGATPSGATTVRYALDYLSTALNIVSGASGNLRDSAPEVITISGVDRPLYNVAPHFELPVVALGE